MTSPETVHITTVHPASDVRIFEKECKTLVRSGFRVTLLAPGAEPGMAAGVDVRMISMPGSRLGRMTVGMVRALWRAIRCRAALYHFHDPELLFAGLILRALGYQVIFDVHEDLHDDLVSKEYLPPFMRQILAKAVLGLGRWSSRHFSAIVAATPDIGSRFDSTCKRVRIIHNFPPREEFPAISGRHGRGSRCAFAYVGVIDRPRGIREMVQAMDLLPRGSSAVLTLAGPFSSEALLNEMRGLPAWRNVEYTPWLNRAGVRDYLSGAAAGLVVLHPKRAFLSSYPTKLFEYMAAGIPVVASDFPLWRQIIEGAGCGLLVDPLDSKSIAAALGYILMHPRESEEMGRRGRKAFEELYNWEPEGQKLVELYKELLDGICAA